MRRRIVWSSPLQVLHFAYHYATTTSSGCVVPPPPQQPPIRGSFLRDRYGYPLVTINGTVHRLHRLALEHLIERSLTADEGALHRCHNRACINPDPDHLYAGSPADSGAAMAAADRSLYGERNPQHKLRESQVREIHLFYRLGFDKVRLAEMFGVSSTMISHIVTGHRWRRVWEAVHRELRSRSTLRTGQTP